VIASARETCADVGIRDGRIIAIGESLAGRYLSRAQPFAPLSMPPHR
jgi:N-acyl-D-aspartate/D-glutamate deacylase